MSGLLSTSKCDCLDPETRNNTAAAIAGILFFTGWWIIVDVSASGLSRHEFDPRYYICGICGTVALFMINSVSKTQLRGDALEMDGCMYLCPIAAWLWLFIGFCASFACCIAACWILIGGYLTQDHLPNKWPGIAVLLQNILIFSSSMIYKFGRVEDINF